MNRSLVALVLGVVLSAGGCGDVPLDGETSPPERKIEVTQQAATCVWYIVTSPFPVCGQWSYSPPPGMFDCTSDKNAYPGEVLFFTEANYGGNCAGFNNTTTSTAFPTLGDYNDRVWSVKNNFGSYISLYQNTYYGWNYTYLGTGVSLPNTSSNGYSSIRR